MTLQKYLTLFAEIVVALFLFMLMIVYGGTGHLIATFRDTGLLLWGTLHGKYLYSEFYGVVPSTFWYSIRLIVTAVVFAVIGGMLFAIGRIRVKSKIGQMLIENITSIWEAIPEPMYIVLVVLLTLYLIETYAINIPVFVDGPPRRIDTLIPAAALALPAAFYLSRMLSLRFGDEFNAPYVITALSKGASQRRAFYKHIVANVIPFLLRHLPIVAAIVISSELFAEFLLEYKGAFYQLPIDGLGWGQKPRGVAGYEVGYLFVLGALLILIWLIIRLFSQTGFNLLFRSDDVGTHPFPQPRRISWHWIVVGLILIGFVIVASIFPHLLTANNPFQRHLANFKTDESAPFPPSSQFPLGTDGLGRGLLALTLQGTWVTLYPAIVCTLLVFLASLFLTSLGTARPDGVLAKIIRFCGSVLTALPVFLALLVVLNPDKPLSPHPEITFVAWIVVLEVGRSAYGFLRAEEEWFQFDFVEGAISIGRSRIGILYTHLRKWLTAYSLEFIFAEFTRILSLMTMLAVFRIYAVEGKVWDSLVPSTTKVIGSLQNTWFSILGNSILSGIYISYSFLIYAPVIALLLVMVGSNLIARGVRGHAS